MTKGLSKKQKKTAKCKNKALLRKRLLALAQDDNLGRIFAHSFLGVISDIAAEGAKNAPK